MTPVEMMDKWLDTQDAEFLSELEGADLWAFLEAYIPDVVSDSYEYCGFEDYFTLHQLVVAEKRREYDAEVDVWMHHFAHQQYGHAKAKFWIETLEKYQSMPELKLNERMHMHDVIQYLKDL